MNDRINELKKYREVKYLGSKLKNELDFSFSILPDLEWMAVFQPCIRYDSEMQKYSLEQIKCIKISEYFQIEGFGALGLLRSSELVEALPKLLEKGVYLLDENLNYCFNIEKVLDNVYEVCSGALDVSVRDKLRHLEE